MNLSDNDRTSSARASSRTRLLLIAGAAAGPLYVIVSLVQGATRQGFDLGRHAWSLLANGDLGWIQVANLLLAGSATIALAVGLARTLSPGRGAIWGPRLIGTYGAGMVAAGIFRADPAMGFPPGTPEGVGAATWHGTLHFLLAGIGFMALIAGCFVMANRFVAEGRLVWAWGSRIVGIVFLGAFAAVASGAGTRAVTTALTVAVIMVSLWLTMIAADRYRRLETASTI